MAYYSKFKTLPRVVVDIQRCLLIMLTKNYGNTSERDVKAKENYLTRLIKKKKTINMWVYSAHGPMENIQLQDIWTDGKRVMKWYNYKSLIYTH